MVGGGFTFQVTSASDAQAPNAVQLNAPNYDAGYVYQVFGIMSNTLTTPKLMICPSDDRSPHTNFFMLKDNKTANQYLNNNVVSYFAGVGASENNPQTFLAGDKNIYGGTGGNPNPTDNGGFGNGSGGTTPWTANGKAVCLGTNLSAAPLSGVNWTPSKVHAGQGNILISDGHVDGYSSGALRKAASVTGDLGNSSPAAVGGPNTLLFP